MKKTVIAISLSSIALIACSKSNQSAPTAETPASEIVVSETIATSQVIASSETVITGDSAQNSLDWAGQYKAKLPCADCDAIETQLTLFPDQKYEISETYLGKNDKAFISKGSFQFDPKGSTITLDKSGDERKFFIGENQIFVLDSEGNKQTGEIADLYILKKQIN